MSYSFSPARRMIFNPNRLPETAAQRFTRLLKLSDFGTPVSNEVLEQARAAATEEAKFTARLGG